MTANTSNRTLYIADNLRVMRGMDTGSVDLIATDPPFNAKRLFNAPLGSKKSVQQFDDRWRWDEVTDEWHDLIASDHPAIKELIEAAAVIEGGSVDHRTGKISTGGVTNSVAAYLAWMAPRVVEMRRILKPTGVLFLQCNWEANSYLRLLLDAVFGRSCLINEIAWKCHSAKGLARRRLPRNHGTLFAYGAKAGKWKWNPSFEPYDMNNLDDKTLQQYKKIDAAGRRYTLDNLANPNKDRPNLTYEFLGITRVWRWTKERMEKALADGLIHQQKPWSVPRLIRYLDEQAGRPRDDVWTDVVTPESSDSEWTTRKPIELYRRIVECATDEGDVVLDPFCGCATTCVAAEELKREWIGIDIDPVAETETQNRLYSRTGLDNKNCPVQAKSAPPPPPPPPAGKTLSTYRMTSCGLRYGTIRGAGAPIPTARQNHCGRRTWHWITEYRNREEDQMTYLTGSACVRTAMAARATRRGGRSLMPSDPHNLIQ